MLQSKIQSIQAREVLDSRGFPTVEATIKTENFQASAKVPSGASTGSKEALELRDHKDRFLGKGVLTACKNITDKIQKELIGINIFEQKKIDQIMIDLDGTKNKSKLGANAILAVSLAAARAAARGQKIPLYRYIGGCFANLLPCPMINIINGGVHADNNLNFQEFMIRPIGAQSFSQAMQWGSEIFHTLKQILKNKNYSSSVGDEGGFAPNLESDEIALELILEAIKKANRKPKEEITLALDCAASEFYKDGKYLGKSKQEHVEYLAQLTEKYPIDSIEDGLDEEDWQSWQELTKKIGHKIQIVGDDLLVTNKEILSRALKENSCNSILIKLNQIGTLTETIECINLAKAHQLTTVISHRSGETEDDFIADLSVACSSGQIKTGSLCRSERICKYNRLLQIEEELATQSRYRDSNRCRSLYCN